MRRAHRALLPGLRRQADAVLLRHEGRPEVEVRARRPVGARGARAAWHAAVPRPAPLAGDRRADRPARRALRLCRRACRRGRCSPSTAAHDRDVAMLHGFTGLYRLARGHGDRGRRHGSPTPCPTHSWGRRASPSRSSAGALRALRRRRAARRHRRHDACAQAPPGRAALRGLARLRGQIEAASWPSGHGTAAMTLALCAVLVAAPAWRAGGRAASARLHGRARLRHARARLALPLRRVRGLPRRRSLGRTGDRGAAPRRGRPPEPAPPPGFWWLVGLGAAGALGAAAAAGAGAERITLYPAERTTTVIGSLALSALAVVIVAGTVILASTPGDGPGDRRARNPSRAPPRDRPFGRGASSRRSRVRA